MITYEQFLQIQECKSYDLSVQTTSRKLGIEIYDVRNWWNKTEEEFLEADGRKACELDNYRQCIIELIKICPQISNANVMSRLQEDFSDFDAKKSTFQRYMKNLREQTGIGSAKKSEESVKNFHRGMKHRLILVSIKCEICMVRKPKYISFA